MLYRFGSPHCAGWLVSSPAHRMPALAVSGQDSSLLSFAAATPLLLACLLMAQTRYRLHGKHAQHVFCYVFSVLYGEQARFFEAEIRPHLRHKRKGMLSMAAGGKNLNASQFYLTCGVDLDSLDNKNTIFGEVSLLSYVPGNECATNCLSQMP